MHKVLGVIAEYNPFHNGHLLHLNESKKQAEADYTICIMSGNFIQRGNTSLVNKWVKAEMALLNGVDLVIELPTIYATSSAENFADGAVRILNSLKVVDTLSFGSELSDIDTLNKMATIFYSEPREYTAILSHQLKKGLSFPKARENAVLMYLGDIKTYANVLSQPNNILAIEYLKAMKKSKSTMTPITVKREKVQYHEEGIIDGFASATAIRKLIRQEKFEEAKKVMPNSAYGLLKEEIKKGNYVLDLAKYEKEIIYTLRKMSLSEIATFPDVVEGLENSIKAAASSCNNVYDLINMIRSKRYPQTRIQRILIYCLLGITKKDMEDCKKVQPYVRVLGFNGKGKTLLSEISKANPKLNVITSVKKFVDTCSNKNLKKMIEQDIFATDIYTLGYEYESVCNLDYTNKIISM